jgi:hypothetical protein
MLSIVCFVAIGAVFGFLAPLPAFAAFSIVALIAYAVFTTGFSGLGRFYDVVFAAVALQVGYFLAVPDSFSVATKARRDRHPCSDPKRARTR